MSAIKLSIALAASVVVRWTCPEAGSYYLFSASDASYSDVRVEVSNHVFEACEAAFAVREGETKRVYWVWFRPQ